MKLDKGDIGMKVGIIKYLSTLSFALAILVGCTDPYDDSGRKGTVSAVDEKNENADALVEPNDDEVKEPAPEIVSEVKEPINEDKSDQKQVSLAQEPIDFGLKNSNQVYANLLAVTGVSRDRQLDEEFARLQKTLGPQSNQLVDITSGHVANVVKISGEICDKLVENNALASSFFENCDLTKRASDMSDADKKCLVDNAASKFWGKAEGTTTVMQMIENISSDVSGQNDSKLVAKLVCINVAASIEALMY